MCSALFSLNVILIVLVHHATSALEETPTAKHPSGRSRNMDTLWLRRLIEVSIDVFAPVSNAFDNDLCRNHSLLYKQDALDNKLWALAMFDASAKLPSGLLTGNLVQMGNYDECLALHDVDSIYGTFSGQHCLVTVGEPGFLSTNDVMMIFFNEVHSLKFPTLEGHHKDYLPDDGVPFSGATWSVCIPSSCRPRDLEQHLQATLSHFLGNISIQVPELGCNSWVDPTPPVTAGDVFSITLLAVLVVLVVCSTTYDLLTWEANHRSKVLLAFSAYSNGLSVLRTPTTRSADELSAMYGVRTLASMWIVLVHVFFCNDSLLNLNVMPQIALDWNHFMVFQAPFAVDIFFLLSGTLVCYFFLLERERGVKFNLFRYYLKRYIRITPMLAMCMLMIATPSKFVSSIGLVRSSPRLKEAVLKTVESCSSYGWLGMVFLNNYFDKERLCMSVSWSLSVDMQLFWLSPLLLFAILGRPNAVKTILGTLILIGIGISFVVAYFYENVILNGPTIPFWGVDPELHYFPTHVRFTPWLVGIGLGYFLYRAKKRPVTMSTWHVALGWIASASLVLVLVTLGHHFQQQHIQHSPLLMAAYVAVYRPAFALCVAWLLYACKTGYGGFVNTFMSWSLFEVMSKVTYSVYLVHWQLVSMTLLVAKKGTEYYNDLTLAIDFFGILVLSFMLGFGLTLLVEMPAVNLANALLAKDDKDLKKSS